MCIFQFLGDHRLVVTSNFLIREVSVNLRDLAPCPNALRSIQGQRSPSESLNLNGENADNVSVSRVNLDVCGTNDPQSDSPVNESDLSLTEPEFIPRRSA